MQRIKCKNYFIYKFNDCEALFDAVSALYEKNNAKARLYTYNKQYFLEVNKCITHFKYKTPYSQKYIKNILEEYGKLISENAIIEIGKAIKDS